MANTTPENASSEIVLESLPEIDGCPMGVVAKSTAAPCAENEHGIAEQPARSRARDASG
jgi:hypothetical protein